MSRFEWTREECLKVVARVESGMSWNDAAPPGVSGHAARQAVRKRGITWDLNKRPVLHPDEALLHKALAIKRTEDVSWPIAAERVGWTKSAPALRRAAATLCRRIGAEHPQGHPGTRRKRGSAS